MLIVASHARLLQSLSFAQTVCIDNSEKGGGGGVICLITGILSCIASSDICRSVIDDVTMVPELNLWLSLIRLALLFALCSHGNNVRCLLSPNQSGYVHQGLHFLQVEEIFLIQRSETC